MKKLFKTICTAIVTATIQPMFASSANLSSKPTFDYARYDAMYDTVKTIITRYVRATVYQQQKISKEKNTLLWFTYLDAMDCPSAEYLRIQFNNYVSNLQRYRSNILYRFWLHDPVESFVTATPASCEAIDSITRAILSNPQLRVRTTISSVSRYQD